MKLLTYILTLSLLISACSQSTKHTQRSKEKSSEDIAKENVEDIRRELTIVFAENSETDKRLIRYYTEASFSPIWSNGDSLNSNGLTLFNFISNAYKYGVIRNLGAHRIQSLQDSLKQFDINHPKRLELLTELDLRLSTAGIQFLADYHLGFVEKDTTLLTNRIDSLAFNSVKQFFDNIRNGQPDSVMLADFGPQHPEAKSLLALLPEFVSERGLSTDKFRVPNYKTTDSSKVYSMAKEALITHGFADSSILADDSAFVHAMEKFQVAHGLLPDFKIGNYTSDALNMSNEERYLKIIATLEKWKNADPFEGDYMYVNIASYYLKFYESGRKVRTHRVVVGAPYTKTPEFSARLKYITVNPRWHVPYSISSKEILPQIKKDESYLSRNGYKVYTSDHKLVDASEVDWNSMGENNFKYRIVQNSGNYNSLGRVAFMFPNEHYVFIHDTPSKYFFSRDVRAFSHGCVRLQDPMELAEYILEYDENEYTKDSLDSLYSRHVESRIYLNKPVDVHIRYYCAEVVEGKIILFRDVYGRDTDITSQMKTLIDKAAAQAQIL